MSKGGLSSSSATKNELKVKIKEENGKFFVVKENMFKSEEIELEGIKIKQVLKLKVKKNKNMIKLAIVDVNDLIYGIVVNSNNKIEKQLIINQEIENELYNNESVPQAL